MINKDLDVRESFNMGHYLNQNNMNKDNKDNRDNKDNLTDEILNKQKSDLNIKNNGFYCFF